MEIMECRLRLRRSVIPIFYHVDPSNVRKQTGSFEKAFVEHEKRLWNMKSVTCWIKTRYAGGGQLSMKLLICPGGMSVTGKMSNIIINPTP